MTTNPATQYATDRNLRARQRLWERQEPGFDVVAWTLDLVGVMPGFRVLDVGCGNGRYLAAPRSLGAEAVGCDLSVGILKTAPTDSVVTADAVALPFPAGRFDVVLAPHTRCTTWPTAEPLRESSAAFLPEAVVVSPWPTAPDTWAP